MIHSLRITKKTVPEIGAQSSFAADALFLSSLKHARSPTPLTTRPLDSLGRMFVFSLPAIRFLRFSFSFFLSPTLFFYIPLEHKIPTKKEDSSLFSPFWLGI
eukprot:TRINITY_DN19984_c0_g1_i1.p1 TRINITY_DN19984_c0_g1~~TRINITY_DN19984_c0_g1_i1.p1  ORF type:complete len:102 (+),score=0.78 TRINITY_DN19984_c0_g1_i1:183-488(+)